MGILKWCVGGIDRRFPDNIYTVFDVNNPPLYSMNYNEKYNNITILLYFLFLFYNYDYMNCKTASATDTQRIRTGYFNPYLPYMNKVVLYLILTFI